MDLQFRILVPLETPVVPVPMRREALAGRAETGDTPLVTSGLEERVVMAASEEMEPVAKEEQAVLRRIAAHPLDQEGLAVEAETVAEALEEAVELEATGEMQLATSTRVGMVAMAATAETDSEAMEVVEPREERACLLVAAAAREVGVFSRLGRRAWEVLVG